MDGLDRQDNPIRVVCPVVHVAQQRRAKARGNERETNGSNESSKFAARCAACCRARAIDGDRAANERGNIQMKTTTLDPERLSDLRDLFAAAALTGLAPIGHETPQRLARRAFQLADEAIKVREEKPVSD